MKSRWVSGTRTLQESVDQWLDQPDEYAAQTLSQTAYRRIVHLAVGSPPVPIVVKEFLPTRTRPTVAKRAIAMLQRLTRHTPALREWKALKQLHEAGIPVPEPLAFAKRPGGGALVVTRHVDKAKTLDEALNGHAFERRRVLRSVGELVFRLHSAGWFHGDLHIGNILIGDRGPVLIDLQRVQTIKSSDDCIRDIAFLDFSLHHLGVTRSNRLRLRIAALGLGYFRVASERETLRRIGRASQARAIEYYRGRTRRTLRPGREFVALQCGDHTGLRVADFSQQAVALAVEAHRHQVENRDPALLKSDHRSRVSAVDALGSRVVVKEVVKSTVRKRLADALRGSAGRRAWVGGHGLRIRGIAVATPMAYLERRRMGIPISSLVILEDLSGARCVADVRPEDPEAEALAGQLLRFAIRLHRTGALHADLQSTHIYLAAHRGETKLALIDLEGIRFPARLRDRHRVQMLSELNATLDDDLIGAGPRNQLMNDYLRALPFDRGNERAVREIVRRSLARNQRWRGTDCDLTRRSG